MTELTDTKADATADTKTAAKTDGKAKPAPRIEHVLKAPIIQQGEEVPKGVKVMLTESQATRFKATGTI